MNCLLEEERDLYLSSFFTFLNLKGKLFLVCGNVRGVKGSTTCPKRKVENR